MNIPTYVITMIGEGMSEKNKKRKWLYQFLPPEMTRGIFSFVIEHKSKRLPFSEHDKSTIKKLEQVVVKTSDCDGFIKVYRDLFGIRLALDSFVEAWKKRMLFFRLNKTTIEVIEEKNGEVLQTDSLWGCLLYTSPSPRDFQVSRMPSSA